ncbi:MAG TPA: hypothetical protein VF092_09530 [Longimicrobium sp.]
MPEDPTTLWAEFWRNFSQLVNISSVVDLSGWFGSAPKRTALYRDRWLPLIASSMGLELVREFCHIDFAFCKRTPRGAQVPVILLESENQIEGSSHELRKLCCISAPVRILLTWEDRTKTFSMWKRRAQHNDRIVRKWLEVIDDCDEIWPDNGIIRVVVAEKHVIPTPYLEFEALDLRDATIDIPPIIRDISGDALIQELQSTWHVL